ncbi:MAG: YebC/PmpR family DNA-binding transcriptional regulator [Patescibacteria group bacterium]
MSGHSKWSNIKHKKATEDKKRANIFSKFNRLISVAAREGGDNPETNFALRAAIDKARYFNMPQGNIDRAIKRGTGEIEGLKFETLLLEGFGPGGIAVLIEAVTDNKNRTLNEVRQILERGGGKLASGGVSWMFERKGVIQMKNTRTPELELSLIEAGAEDIKYKDDILEIHTRPEEMDKVKMNLGQKKIKVEDLSIDFVPKEEIEIKEAGLKSKIESLFETLDGNDDVQDIYSNVKM